MILTNVLQNVYKSSDVSNIIDNFRINYENNLLCIFKNNTNFIKYCYDTGIRTYPINRIIKVYKNISIDYAIKFKSTKLRSIRLYRNCLVIAKFIYNNIFRTFLYKRLYKNHAEYYYSTTYERDILYIKIYNINNLIYKINKTEYKKYLIGTCILIDKARKQMFINFNFTYYNKYMYLF